MAIADRIVVMNQGRIEQDGPAREVYLRPRNLFVAGFMGELNRIPVTDGQSPLGPIVPGTGTLCIRPEAIAPDGPLALGPARVTDAAFLGSHVRAHMSPLAAPDIRLVVHLPQGSDAVVGTEMALFARAHVMLEG